MVLWLVARTSIAAIDNEQIKACPMSAPESEKARETGSVRRNLLVPEVQRWDVASGAPIVEFKEVHKRFGDDQVLRGLNLTIEPGKITVIIGASGSGKSVLIKHMNGLIQPDKGEVRLFGQDVRKLSGPRLDALRKRVGTMFQNYALFDSMTVEENVAFPLIENKAMRRPEALERAGTILEELGLGHARQQMPATLSGGMKKRVSLARSIVYNPELVLFDEPTTGLDPAMMEFVDQMIEEITEKYQLTSVLISHDMATIFRIADQVAVLHGGEIIACGEPEEIAGKEDERIQSLAGGDTKSDIRVGSSERCEASKEAQCTALMKDVHKSFREDAVLRGIDFEAHAGEVTTLIGGSGEGKSVMMKHLLGLMKPDRGEVRVLGENLAGMSEGELRRLRTRIGMLFQHSALFDSLTVRENIAFPLVERRICGRREAMERADALMEKLLLEGIGDANTVEISSGQSKRVSLARALATEPELLIFDEPTTGQDPIMSRYVEQMINQVQDEFDVTTIVISHNMALAFRTADKIAMLKKGQIIAYGTPQRIAEIAREDERVYNFVYAADVAKQKRGDAKSGGPLR